jgi:hypothetical protein
VVEVKDVSVVVVEPVSVTSAERHPRMVSRIDKYSMIPLVAKYIAVS